MAVHAVAYLLSPVSRRYSKDSRGLSHLPTTKFDQLLSGKGRHRESRGTGGSKPWWAAAASALVVEIFVDQGGLRLEGSQECFARDAENQMVAGKLGGPCDVSLSDPKCPSRRPRARNSHSIAKTNPRSNMSLTQELF